MCASVLGMCNTSRVSQLGSNLCKSRTLGQNVELQLFSEGMLVQQAPVSQMHTPHCHAHSTLSCTLHTVMHTPYSHAHSAQSCTLHTVMHTPHSHAHSIQSRANTCLCCACTKSRVESIAGHGAANEALHEGSYGSQPVSATNMSRHPLPDSWHQVINPAPKYDSVQALSLGSQQHKTRPVLRQRRRSLSTVWLKTSCQAGSAGRVCSNCPWASCAQPGGWGYCRGRRPAGWGHDARLQDCTLAGRVPSSSVLCHAHRLRRLGVCQRGCLCLVHLGVCDSWTRVPCPHS